MRRRTAGGPSPAVSPTPARWQRSAYHHLRYQLSERENPASSLLKNLNSSVFVLRFSSSYKRSVRFGSECSRLVATLSLSRADAKLGGQQFGNADQVIGDQVEQEIGSDASDAAM